MSQRVSHPDLEEFFQWECQSWVEVVADITTDGKAHFMPVETLRSYFQANDSRKLNRILSDVFQSEDIPVAPEVILRGYTAVFCILLRISRGRYIEDFVRFEELSDQRLPFDPAHPPAYFPEAADDPDFLQQFCERQWMYCVPIFDDHMIHKNFGRQRLLPIIHKEKRAGGGSAAIYKIKLYGPHNKLIPTGSDIQMNSADPNTFILKRHLTKDEYRQEVKNFSNSKHSESITRFYGSYTHGDESDILLELADKGTLEEYFQRQAPPSRGGDIIKFWDGLFQLIKALKAIHSILEWHQDVKPASVLVLSYGAESAFDWQFKLADFGLSHSISKVTSEENLIPNDSRSAQTYGAPECHMPYNLDGQGRRISSKVTQAADIWSLGCIYSEAAMWIADGYNGIVDYRRQRVAEIDKMPGFSGGDCFHDGERVLRLVLDAHKDVQQRLRWSDYITKDVLDSMAEEMLWEEDRPGAKALWRRAEGVLSRARQKLSLSTVESSFTRPNNNNRSLTYALPQDPPHPPPERPLPERPRVLTARSNSAQRQYPANVEMWRSQVRVPSTELISPVYGGGPKMNPETISELDLDITSSISSWQGGNNNSLASQLTSPFTSPHASTHFHSLRQLSTEGRRGPLKSLKSYENKNPSKRSYARSYTNTTNLSNDGLEAPISPQPPAEFAQGDIAMLPTNGKRNSGSIIDNARTSDRGSQYSSSAYSALMTSSAIQEDLTSSPLILEDPHLLYNSEKRSQGLSLFPTKISKGRAPLRTVETPLVRASTPCDSPVARSDSVSNNSVSRVPTYPSDTAQFVQHLSLPTALDWKKAHKKSKKSARVPPGRGADLLDKLNDRDHVFIIDDGISMREQWPRVKMVFEALSYILKPMAPDGIELYFTVAYDTWRRHNTSELVDCLEKKGLAGETDLSYRLGLQLQDYMLRTQPGALATSKKAKKVRPISYYILTDGNWNATGDLIAAIKDIADHLIDVKLKRGQLTIQFVTFGQDAAAIQRVNDIANTDFGLDIVATTHSTGNVFQMLYGALDKSHSQRYGPPSGTASSASTLVLPLTVFPPIELA